MEPIKLIRSKDYEKNIKRFGNSSKTCEVCGRQTAGKLFIHMNTNGSLFSNDVPDDHPDSQGAFPIGPECAKQYPKDYIAV